MFLLDTNVISELIRPNPNPAVVNWVAGHLSSKLFISVITEMELIYGIAILPSGRRRTLIAKSIESMLQEDFSGRILPFDRKAASASALIRANRRKLGKKIQTADAQIAGIAYIYETILVTANEKDFVDCGIEIVNPWNS